MKLPPTILESIRLDLDEDGFNEAALELFRFQAKCNIIYRQFLKKIGVNPGEVVHWKSIPALPVSSFRTERVACFPPIETQTVFKTSGTTSETTGCHELATLEYYEKSLSEWFLASVPDVSHHQWISLIPSFEERPQASLSFMVSYLSKSVAKGSVDFLVDAQFNFDPCVVLSRIIQRAETGKPLFLLGTTFAFARLIEEMMDNRIRTYLPEGSILFDTGGYKGHQRHYPVGEYLDMFEESLSVRPSQIFNEYGMTECSSQAYTPMDVQLHVFPPWCRSRIRNPVNGDLCEPGEKGIVQIIDLANVNSVCAISTMDAGIDHGSGLELCGRIETAAPRGCSLDYE